MSAPLTETCDCGDGLCPVAHKGPHGRCNGPATVCLFRIDMEDETGTDFCEGCAADAMESGLFTDSKESDE